MPVYKKGRGSTSSALQRNLDIQVNLIVFGMTWWMCTPLDPKEAHWLAFADMFPSCAWAFYFRPGFEPCHPLPHPLPPSPHYSQQIPLQQSRYRSKVETNYGKGSLTFPACAKARSLKLFQTGDHTGATRGPHGAHKGATRGPHGGHTVTI